MFARAVKIVSAPCRLGLRNVDATLLAFQHSTNTLGGVGGGGSGTRCIECTFDVTDDKPEGKKDKNKTDQWAHKYFRKAKTGRGERIRTSGPLLPKQVRYQAALHPDGFSDCDGQKSGRGPVTLV